MSVFSIVLCIYLSTAIVEFVVFSLIIASAIKIAGLSVSEKQDLSYADAKQLIKKNGFYFRLMFLSSFVVSVIPLLNFATLVQIIVTNGKLLEESLSKAFSSRINESIEKERRENNGA